MATRHKHAVFLIGLLALTLAAAGLWWYLHPAPGPLRLTRTTFADVPGWTSADAQGALDAFRRSCAAIAKQADAAAMGRYGGTAADWREVCAAAQSATPAQPRAFFEVWFTPFAIGAGRARDGRFTGYYEPQIRGSHKRHGPYRTPVYGRPDDLVTADLGAFRPSLKGESIAGKVEDGSLVPYASRGEIDAHGLKHARVLFYTDDEISLFFLHIQGSGRVVFDDGSVARVTYAAQNGRPYTAVGKTLMARGVPREGMSMQVIRAWLKAHPKDARAVMESDASYVFFNEEPVGDPALGARGAEGVPLTPMASLAVDPRLNTLGAPYFVSGDLDRLFIAQDIGGAIRGAVRGDVYFGFGSEAEDKAGKMDQTGRMFVLLPKALARRMKDEIDFSGT
ncbi:MAG TPA: murein transglycosylase A [Rhizomicrobium sp.]|nr:murein transglycosylase A [Rhizomicrobium sp.]